MNNAIFSKLWRTCAIDVKLLTWDGRYSAEIMIAKLNFHSRNVFSENLIAMMIEIRKLELKFNKPIRRNMYNRYIESLFVWISPRIYVIAISQNIKKYEIMYTDTDSLEYIASSMMNKWNVISLGSKWDYSIDMVYHLQKKCQAIKGENNGAILTEFVELRAKMYALRIKRRKVSEVTS